MQRGRQTITAILPQRDVYANKHRLYDYLAQSLLSLDALTSVPTHAHTETDTHTHSYAQRRTIFTNICPLTSYIYATNGVNKVDRGYMRSDVDNNNNNTEL